MCRGEFAKLEDLTHEVAFNRSLKIKKKKGSENGDGTSFHIFRSIEKPVKHEYICAICGCYPVIGRLYGMKSGDRRATIETISSTLCSKCFENQTADYAANSEIGQQVFFWKDKPSDKWLKVPQNFGLIAGFDRTIIANSEYGSVSEALTKTLCLVELGRITKWTIRPMRETLAEKTGNLMRSERPRGLLAPGRQCRICLMHFREEEEVRKLSGCNHIFHTKCIDQWLLHASPCCPLDGIFAAPPPMDLRSQTERLSSGKYSSFRGTVKSTLFELSDDLLKISNFAHEMPTSVSNHSSVHIRPKSNLKKSRRNTASTIMPLEAKPAVLTRRCQVNAYSRTQHRNSIRPSNKESQVCCSKLP
uniref:RING-type domain-containing protein n=1 Tax=Mesocestoides corti TaxID=53468 RepID=A0A5K3F1W5_MESCO